MNSSAIFVSELIRAANQIDKVSVSEVRLLLQRSIVTVRDLRYEAGIPVDGTPEDALVRLKLVSEECEGLKQGERADALLKAADLIRTLGILVDSGTYVSVRPVD
ncbi:hypothetical protein ACC716_24805 [Rhizobium johnstonii]|uniref:hypothetical protein n=1 Tax=Rhizobium TaxID=379 RepID=UPI001C905056|nr:hypothetical protein [Rhizobium laguerreae]MBY3328526.1 hypothetical protein [Rhizobium laguerreae]